MNFFIVLSIFIATNLTAANINVANKITKINTEMPSHDVTVDEVLVESSLRIKPKERPQLRRVRRSILDNFNILNSLAEHRRVKRQFGQSQATSNAAVHQNYNNLYGFGNSAANVQAQAFDSHGPTVRFGSAAVGSLTQALNGNSYGVQNPAASSHGLTFNLPKGQSVNFASTNSFANASDASNANSRASAVSINRI